MAVRFDAAADRLLRTSNLLDYDANYTVLMWIRIVTDTNDFVTIFGLNRDSLGTGADSLALSSDGTTFGIVVIMDDGTPYTAWGTNLSVGTWYHVALVRSAANNRVAYLNGVVDATVSDDPGSRSNPTRMEVGGTLSSNIYPFNGRVFNIQLYDTALTQAQIQAQMYRMLPHLTANLYGWYPTFPGSGERARDYSGNGHNWTEVGTLTDEDPPPVSWGTPVYIIPFVAGGVEESVSLTLTQSLAASLVGGAVAAGGETLPQSLAAAQAGAAQGAGSATLAVNEVISSAAGAQAAADETLSMDHAQSQITIAQAAAACSIDVIQQIAQAAAAQAASSGTLGLTQAISLAVTAIRLAALALAMNQDVSQAAAAQGASSEILALYQEIVSTANAQAAAAQGVTIIQVMATVAGSQAESEISLDLSSAEAFAADVQALASIALGDDFSIIIAAQRSSTVGLTLTVQEAMDAVASVIRRAGITLDTWVAIQLAETVIIAVPAVRRFTVPLESRLVDVAAESRTLTVQAESRSRQIPAESRVFIVPDEDRDWDVN